LPNAKLTARFGSGVRSRELHSRPRSVARVIVVIVDLARQPIGAVGVFRGRVTDWNLFEKWRVQRPE